MNFQARQYDPQLGRFLEVDPLADAGGQDIYSPYAAMGNAPESMVDPNGTYAYAKDFSYSRAEAIGMLDAMFGVGNYFIDEADNGRIMITNPKAASATLDVFMKTTIGGGTAAVTQMAVNAGQSILNHHNDPTTSVVVSFGKNHIADNCVSDFTWSRRLNETEIYVDGSSATVYGDGTKIRQRHTDDARMQAWIGAKREGYVPLNPDATVLTVPMSLIGITGVSGSFNIGLVGDEFGMFVNYGYNLGTPDVGVGLGLTLAEYKGQGGATFDSYMGYGQSWNAGFALFGSYSEGYANYGDTKPIWQSYSGGIVAANPSANWSPMNYSKKLFSIKLH